jgi:hypothetical protein
MTKSFALILLATASASRLHAQVELPDLYIYNYTITQRDPFIASDAPSTFLSQNREICGIVSSDIVRQYLQRIIQLVKEELYVGGYQLVISRFKASLSSTALIFM